MFKNWKVSNYFILSTIFDLVVLFSVLAVFVNKMPFIKEVNLAINQTFLEKRADLYVGFFKYITHFGETELILAFSLILLVYLWKTKKTPEFWSLFTLSSLSAVLITITKNIVKEPRPEFSITVESSYSFPSGHSTIAIAFYGLLIWYFFMRDRKTLKNIPKILLGVIFMFLIPFSRLVLGVHYFFDVVGGIILGLICLLTAILVFINIRDYKKS